MKKPIFTFWFLAVFATLLSSCGDGGFNLFTIEDDRDLGAQIDDEIESDDSTYPILSESSYPEAYAYLRGIRDRVLASDSIRYEDEFAWQVHIINDDETLNAFATPGGYLYFYTGLIHYLDDEDSFAGVMAHEIAHAERRHTTDALTRQYGTQILLEILLGSQGAILQEIATGLAELSFSRGAESEADEYSVNYLSDTVYACDGAAHFFQKLIAEGDDSNAPEFLSTHPSSDSRVASIQAHAEEVGCSTALSGRDYAAFQAMLP